MGTVIMEEEGEEEEGARRVVDDARDAVSIEWAGDNVVRSSTLRYVARGSFECEI